MNPCLSNMKNEVDEAKQTLEKLEKILWSLDPSVIVVRSESLAKVFEETLRCQKIILSSEPEETKPQVKRQFLDFWQVAQNQQVRHLASLNLPIGVCINGIDTFSSEG